MNIKIIPDSQTLYSGAGKPTEICLLTNMINQIKCQLGGNGSCSFFPAKVHGTKVSYMSPLLNQKVTREIADLMIICNLRFKKEIRLSFMQAKREVKMIKENSILDKFNGEYFQWELLKERPTLLSSAQFPKEILSFTNYKSITSYGIFYKNFKSKWRIEYFIPEYCNPKSQTAQNKQTRRIFYINNNDCRNDSSCYSSVESKHVSIKVKCKYNSNYNKDEEPFAEDTDSYYGFLLDGRIGAPINKETNESIKYYMQDYTELLLNSKLSSQNARNTLIQLNNDLSNLNIASSYNHRNEHKENNYINTLIINIDNAVNNILVNVSKKHDSHS